MKENPQDVEEDTNSEKDSEISSNGINVNQDESEDGFSGYDADKPCPFCGEMHVPITKTIIPKPFGFIIRLTPKQSNKEENEEKNEEKKEEDVE